MSSISVVMSTSNAKVYIAESVESVLKQSFSDFELIVISDSSTDNNIKSIINSYHDKRIRLIDNDHDYIQSLNSGIRASKGKYIALMNAGDIMHADRLKIQYSIMEEFPDITVCSRTAVFGIHLKFVWKSVKNHTIDKYICKYICKYQFCFSNLQNILQQIFFINKLIHKNHEKVNKKEFRRIGKNDAGDSGIGAE